MTQTSLETVMTLVDGLTRKRTQEYLRELEISGVVLTTANGSLRMKRSVAHIIGLIAKKQAPELSID